MTTIFAFIGAALAEIAGCFAFWAWLRLDKSVLWVVPGILSLVLFAYLLTRVDSPFAGRAYAAYGGVYIAAGQPERRHHPQILSAYLEGGAARTPAGPPRRSDQTLEIQSRRHRDAPALG